MNGGPVKTADTDEPTIHQIRGQRVVLDADLARIYGVTTKRLNQQIQRNHGRFPSDFIFQLDRKEIRDLNRSQFATGSEGTPVLRLQNATSKDGRGGRRYRPWAFTEHGAIMAATVLNSSKAVEMSVFVVRAFVKMREALSVTQTMEKRLAEVEKTLLVHDTTLWELYERIKPLLLPPPVAPKRRIGFRTEDARR